MQIWTKPLPVLLISGLAATASAGSGGESDSAPAVPTLTDQPAEDGKTENSVINAYFKDGLRFETGDKNFTMRIGTRIAFDSDFINVNNDYEQVYGLEEDGSRFRMARILAEGTINKNIE